MRGREQHRDRRDYGEGGERDEAEPVDDHGRKLPVHDDLVLLVAYLHPVRDELELLQDALQLPVGRGRTVVSVARGAGPGGGRRPRIRGHWRGLSDPTVGLQRVPVHPDKASRRARRKSSRGHNSANANGEKLARIKSLQPSQPSTPRLKAKI